MAVTSIFDIVSAASIRLGSVAVQSFDEATRESEIFSVLWPQCLDELLSLGIWNFATKDFVLSQIVGSPADRNWNYQYQLPADFMTARYAMDDAGARIPYVIQGQTLYANLSGVTLKYIRRYAETDIPSLPAWFVELFISALASQAAEPLIGISDVRETSINRYAAALKNARIRNSKDEPSTQALAPSRITLSRFRGAGSV
jgi:hypothetical protein